MKEQTCCFIGHREIEDTAALREQLKRIVRDLIGKGTIRFLFGDRSAFNDLCYELVTAERESHPEIRRIHYRFCYETADAYTMHFLLAGYEESICPKGVGNAGKASYAERNQAMIRESDICVFYYRKETANPKSGTASAYVYAVRKGKCVILLSPE